MEPEEWQYQQTLLPTFLSPMAYGIPVTVDETEQWTSMF